MYKHFIILNFDGSIVLTTKVRSLNEILDLLHFHFDKFENDRVLDIDTGKYFRVTEFIFRLLSDEYSY